RGRRTVARVGPRNVQAGAAQQAMTPTEPVPASPPARRRRLRRYVGAFLLATLLGLYLGRSWILPHVAGFLDVSEPPHAVDFVMVLGGGDDTRPFVAAALYEAGMAKAVLVPATKRGPEVEDAFVPPEAAVIRMA